MERPPASQESLERIHLRLTNFRAFRDSRDFVLAPLTCLVGANSSGKSSIISAILLLKQSCEREVLSTRVTPLALSGRYCDLGSFEDLVYNHRTSSPLGFTFSIPMSALLRRPRRSRPIIDLELPRSALGTRVYPYWEPRVRIPDKGSVEIQLQFVTDEPFGPSLSRIELHADEVGSTSLVRTVGGERRQHWRVYAHDLPRQSLSMGFRPGLFFPTISVNMSVYERSPSRTKHRINVFVTICRLTLQYLRDLFAMTEVIGPFRTPPERRYTFGGFSSTRGGPSGEQAVDLLITERLLKASGHRLRSTVSFWLRHLKLATQISIDDIARNMNLFQLNLRGAGQARVANFADVGYGISQVLPVLVQGLLMHPGSTYMVQQPELHLHPDAQAGLADFFLALTSQGIRAIVETHSEYFLIRLRRRLAEGRLGMYERATDRTRANVALGRDHVSVLLTQVDKRKGSSVTELSLGDSFQFDNLPADFMSQAIQDRVALLKALGNKK